jgi:hypothetical protein
MSKLVTMREAIGDLVPDGASVALGLQMEQMIPFRGRPRNHPAEKTRRSP